MVFAGLEEGVLGMQAGYQRAEDECDHGPIIGRKIEKSKKKVLQFIERSCRSSL
jgi:hypothetical protein